MDRIMRATNYLKLAIIALLLSAKVAAQQNHSKFFENAGGFFRNNVLSGKVKYRKVKDDPGQLNELLQYLKDQGTLDVTTDEEKALLINAYNLFVIKGIVDSYPVASPLKVAGFFDRKDFDVGGRKVSLNELEKDILIKQTQDPRLHFVLVCAAVGCPKIAGFAYEPQKLEEQLDDRTGLAMNDPYFTRVDDSAKKVELSQIFEWYKRDFTKTGQSLLEFVNQYREEQIPLDYKIAHYTYDWTVNEEADNQGAVAPQKLKKESSNLLQFTPSQLFARGQYEINFFNNLYSQTAIRNAQGERISSGIRTSILTSMIQYTMGVSKNRRFNLGADLIIGAGSVGPSTESSHFQLFGGSTAARDLALAAIGPRVKFQPFRRWGFFSIQSTFLIPLGDDLEGQNEREVFVALNRYNFKNQFLADFKLTEKFRLFYEFAANYYIRRNKEEVFFQPNFIDLPSTLFVNYFPSSRWNLFVMGQYAPRLGRTALPEDPTSKFGLLQWLTQLGAGLKYQATEKVGFEVSYGNFVASQGIRGIEAGAGQVVNFAVRFISL